MGAVLAIRPAGSFVSIQKRQLLFIAVVQEHEKDQDHCCTGNIDIGDIKNRKIDQAKINEIAHIRDGQ